MHFEYKIEGGDFTGAGYASSQIKKVLKQLDVDHNQIKRIVVALYESEVNIVAHAYNGLMVVDIDIDKIVIRMADNGPGIEDIDKAMQQGFSTASPKVREMGFGAGMGLPNIKKNVDELEIKSTVGVGTVVKMVNYFK